MANSAAMQDVTWHDFDTLRHSIKSYTVDRLKQIITGLSDECGALMAKSGKKQDLIDRITTQLDNYRHTQQTERWNRARAVLYQVRSTGIYTHGQGAATSAHPSASAGHDSATTSNAHVNGYHHSSNGAGPSSVGRYDPTGIPRRAVPPPTGQVKQGVNTNIKFKASPFFLIDQAVSGVVECPESSGSTDRRSQTLQFALTQDQLTKLTLTSPKYQLRLFCTSSSFYSSQPAFRSNTSLCPIEFPATCEVRINNVPLSANVKGVKKKPGTAPPADLGRSVSQVVGVQNRVEMVYVNSQQNNQQPAAPKKYYLVVFLVEVTTVEQLVEKLRKGKYRSLDDIRANMIRAAAVDDDIIAGNQTMSLKCPLSYTRIKTPCRSDKCVHSQCFDAYSWYSVMEQTTTWLCPVCEKILSPEDLIVDGYFDAILKEAPESVDDVIVEPEGEWYTADKKHGSAGWRAAQAMERGVTKRTAPSPSKPNGGTQSLSSPGGKGSASANAKRPAWSNDIVVLDSDDEDEGRVKRELSPSFGHINGDGKISSSSSSHSKPTSSQPTSKAPKASRSVVIDLTLDSDDEAPKAAPTRAKAEKRKADEAQLSQVHLSPKRSRPDINPPTMARHAANGYVNTSPPSTSATVPTRLQPHPPLPPSPHSPSVASPSVNLPLPAPSTNVRHHNPPPAAAYGPGQYSYQAPYNPPRPPTRPGSYDPIRPHDPRAARPYQPSYHNTNPYLPRMNGSGGWP